LGAGNCADGNRNILETFSPLLGRHHDFLESLVLGLSGTAIHKGQSHGNHGQLESAAIGSIHLLNPWFYLHMGAICRSGTALLRLRQGMFPLPQHGQIYTRHAKGKLDQIGTRILQFME
jgi:hypothetical protein